MDWLDALAQSDDGDRRTGAYIIRQTERARDLLRYQRPLQSPLKEAEGVKIWKGTGDRASERLSKLESLRQAASAAGLERDFTTPGTPGKLGCPFGTPSLRGRSTSGRGSMGTPSRSQSRILPHAMRSKRSSFNDPIRADTCAFEPPLQSPEPSVSGSAVPVCPIRFMDDHSPEEIAKYFENHKHELPRSHEVCIKRFQSNQESIRQLDAKYGNLVNMIQGLGEKHQPMLKESPDEEDAILETESNGRVADWAKAVSTSAQAGGDESPGPDDALPQEAGDEEERQPHFDRPLKDIRVGESPSRPWGITVPAAYNKPPSVATDAVVTESPVQDSPQAPPAAENKKPGKCPFDHTKLRGGLPPVARVNETGPEPEPKRKTVQPDAQTIKASQPPPIHGPNIIKPGPQSPNSSQMVFTGPVFIGYSMEQAVALLQQTGLARKTD